MPNNLRCFERFEDCDFKKMEECGRKRLFLL